MEILFLFGALGALVAEVVKRWDQLESLPEKKFAALLQSLKFWTAILFLVVLGGLGGIFAFQQTKTANFQVFFISGAGMMLFVRNIVSASVKHKTDHLGEEEVNPTAWRTEVDTRITLRDIFN